MLKRLRTIFRSLFGWLIRGAENPELILRQYMDDLRDQIPRMNEQAAQIVKIEKMLEEQVARQRANVAALQPKVEQAVKMGPASKQAAIALIQALESAKKELAETEAQLEAARANSKKTLEMRVAYERRIREQMNEALRQISRAKRAEMEKQMASLMTSFGVGDTQDTLDRMTQRIDEQLAEARARTEVAATDIESQMAEVEVATEQAAAENLYTEYQRQLGLAPETEPPARTMDSFPVEQEQQAQAAEQQPATEENVQQ
ncbi:MAG: PspA/IM30 family protein [Armatimonadia bacterium]